MGNLLVIKHVTLEKIWISYDSDHTQYKLNRMMTEYEELENSTFTS